MATDIFAKLGDIKGESTDSKHKDEIEVLSFSWGLANTPSGSSSNAAGKATFQDVSIVHTVDKATPGLMKACATGKHFPEAVITQRKAGKGQHEYLIVKMNDVIITSVANENPSSQLGTETVTIKFSKVHLEYKPQKADGSLDAAVVFKYDLKTNKEG
jgi:type VI secretion system secreted protein Hcp